MYIDTLTFFQLLDSSYISYLHKVCNSLEEAKSHIGKAEEILLGKDHQCMEALRLPIQKKLGALP